MSIYIDFLIKIILSVFLGGLIGLERELSHHPAGFRTNILICLGSTLFMFITYFSLNENIAGIQLSIDPTRVAAGVVTGIGFLGAGVIFKKGANVKGLTTAATIWVVSGVGLMVGSGLFFVAIFSTIVIVLVLHIFHFLEKGFLIYHELEYLKLRIDNRSGIKRMIEVRLMKYKVKLSINNFKKLEKELELIYAVGLPRSMNKGKITDILMGIPEVLELEWKDL